MPSKHDKNRKPNTRKKTTSAKGRATNVSENKKAKSKKTSAKKLSAQKSADWKTKYEMISASAGLIIYDYDINTGDIEWSGNSLDVLGYSNKDLGNIDRWVALIHPEDRDDAFTQLETAEKSLKPYNVQYRFSKKNGEYCHIHDRGFFLPDSTGKASRMLGVMNDISERVLAQKTIEDISRFRQSVENAIPDIIFVFDINKQEYLYANKNLLSLLGYGHDELLQMGPTLIQSVIHPDDRRQILPWTDEPNGFVRESEYRMRAKNGEYRCIATRTTPFQRDENGKVIRLIGIAQDITSKKQVANQLSSSEESYRQLFDSVGEAIFIQDEKGKFLDVNKGAALMYGYTKEELIGQDGQFLSAGEKNDFTLINQWFREARAGKQSTFEFWGKQKNGNVFLQEVRLTRGSYFGKDIVIATGWDITDRRKTEQDLRDSEQRFRTLQQASFGGIGLHHQGVIIDCNQGLCDITGYAYSELVGSNGLELIAPEWRPMVMEKILSGYEKTYDVEGIRKDGSRYILEIHGKNIPYEGRMIRVTEFRDVTDRKRAEEKIVEQNAKLIALTEDLVRKNNQLEEFTQIVSHNLRSPVGNIVTLLSFLENASDEGERMEYFSLLRESGATTLSMLNDLNEVLKIKQAKNIEKQNLLFEQVLNDVKAMLNAKIASSSAVIDHDFTEAPAIQYPTIYLESILLNLLDNALKYSSPDRPPRISFKTSLNQGGQITLAVKDNGQGLNLERYGQHIFKMRKIFHRHPESRGIGLFMIKNQIEAMGGEITMQSKEGEGSTFLVTFNKLPIHAT